MTGIGAVELWARDRDGGEPLPEPELSRLQGSAVQFPRHFLIAGCGSVRSTGTKICGARTENRAGVQGQSRGGKGVGMEWEWKAYAGKGQPSVLVFVVVKSGAYVVVRGRIELPT